MLERNRDRGKIKWTALMLPEHVGLLREWQAEDDYVERPELSEWDLESIQEELERGLKMKCQTLVETWHDGKITGYLGTIESVDLHTRRVMLQDPFDLERIKFEDIVSVRIRY